LSKKVDVRGFYEQYFQITDQNLNGDELLVVCPFHTDTKPSLSINLDSGLWKCHAQSCATNDNGGGGGNIATFYVLISAEEDNAVSYNDATEYVRGNFGTRTGEEPEPIKLKPVKDFPVTEEDVERYNRELLENENILKSVQSFGWTVDIIKKYQIGFNITERRVWIPIRENRRLVNIRKYSRSGTVKMLNVTGFGEAKIWPDENLEGDTLYLFEGEKDCILANQLGLNAITVTGGAGTFHLKWAKQFLNKSVYICYDIDLAGKRGADKVADMLSMSAKQIKVVQLPLTDPANADFTDYIQQGNTIQDFHALVARTVPRGMKDSVVTDIPDKVTDTTLAEAMDKKLYFKRSRIKGRVLAKNPASYVVPKHIDIKCNGGNGTKCLLCPINRTHAGSADLDETSDELLEFVESKKKDSRRIISDIMGIPPCDKYDVKIPEHQPIEQVEIIPSLDELPQFTTNDDTGEIIEQKHKYEKGTFYMLDCPVELNQDYEIEAVSVADPRSNELAFIGYKARPSQSSISEFVITDELKNMLRVFQCQTSKQS